MITCPRCGMISYNANDERERYCGNCHMFHADMTLGERLGLYILDDEQVTPVRCPDFLKWAEWMAGVRHDVAQHAFATGDISVKVSTIFLGMDSVAGILDRPPLLWETMTFSDHPRFRRQQWRYATHAEAVKGHADVCRLVEERLARASDPREHP